ncbi:hypothetical protein [Cryptosporangium phraense]|uniref:FtsH ternary system domain-containing protein n=1 Tax=Cryptosporangium phraense TaxID=2593070 RepID=A0A545AZK2_9ACTN|nr:hypothetical protein [Cryptosporangium phraense]TQS46756.1 hypothetical protein FL583_00295 [Cryptosporangium phraense]
MRVRVTFRYNAETGEVEEFRVDDVGSSGVTGRAEDHDARHDRATADVAQVVERNALIEELAPGPAVERQAHVRPSAEPETRREAERDA